MNGPHDVGGMQSFGPVDPGADKQAFHHEWERRVLALTLAMGATGQWNIDQSRSARESIGPARYLASSYYEIWLAGLLRLLVQHGLASADELRSGRPAGGNAPAVKVLRADQVDVAMARGSPADRPALHPAAFAVGDRVRALNRHPQGHTRLPRYARGKIGRIAIVHGTHLFADVQAGGNGRAVEWLYSVAFDAHELWGPDTTADAVHVDCWEPYLESA